MRSVMTFILTTLTLTGYVVAGEVKTKTKPAVKVVKGGEPTQDYRKCRRMLIGPGVNQPDPFPGYGGFVSQAGPIRLRSGTWLLGLSAGYWHVSPPTPLTVPRRVLKQWRKIGMPDVDAPTGGRAMIIRSTDEGITWSKPETLIDTPWGDHHPTFCELSDGTILCSIFTRPGGRSDIGRDPNKTVLVGIIRSLDGGKTWDRTLTRLVECPFTFDCTDAPIIELQDGSALICVYGGPREGGPDRPAFLRSTDSGKTWELRSTVGSDHEMSETGVAQLADGRLVFISRPEGDIAWSDDLGKTWTDHVTFGIRLYEPQLLTLKDGTLLCLHGSYSTSSHGVHAMFSRDGGQTWICPAKDHGFPVDPSAYGYSKGIELPDGSVFVAYIQTGGHRPKDAKTMVIWGIRLRVRADHSGIDLLPAPGLNQTPQPDLQ